jgi:POT family proton-dependent oligopeptide transporter
MTLSERVQEIKTGFSSTFWIANTLELFERLAFYGAKAVLAKFIAEKVGLYDDAGSLAGLYTGLIYFLPVIAGVFVDRYGFKKTLVACFMIFCVGYFLIGLAGMEYGQQIAEVVGKKTYIIAVLVLTAMGGSLIKPCIVGTVSKTSKPSTKALGFSIYYTLVNIGGAIGPIVALTVRQNLGIEFVLIMSSITSFLLIIGTLVFFKEPVDVSGEVTDQRTFSKVFGDMLFVFRDLKFISFLVIFSGFWIIFWQIYFLLPFYSTDVLHYDKFEILETVDAWTIILITIPVTALVAKWKPFTAMTVGFVLASLAWVVMGAMGTVIGAIISMALFGIGEGMQSPRFYEYVSTLAPKNQTGTYMGFAFLPIAIGSYTAGHVADWLRLTYMQTNPSMMWYILAGIGFASTLLMILYDRIMNVNVK